MHTRRLALLGWLGVLAVLPLAAAPDDAPTPALPTIQRVILSPEKIAAELARAPELVKRPRVEFEKLLREAEANAAKGRTARLVEAHWVGVLRDEDLIGSARWEVHCPEGCPATLPLQGPAGPVTPALRRAPRIEDREVLLAEVDARGPMLLFDRPGSHTVDLAWSARLERTQDGLTFDLRSPACPAGVLELYLPAGWQATASAESLVAGPLPMPPADERATDEKIPDGFSLWRVHGIGRGSVRLTLTEATDTQPATLIRKRSSSFRLAPEGVEATLEASLELLPRGGTEVAFEWEPSLRPYAVEVAQAVADGPVPELLEWILHPAVNDRPALLTLRLRQAVAEIKVTVKSLGPLAGKPAANGAIEWSVPALAIVGGVPREETIDLLIHPDLRLDGWQPGDFRLTGTSSVPDVARSVAFSCLSLSGGGVRPENRAAPRRPVCVVHPSVVEFRARPVTWWQIDTRPATLAVAVTCEVQQGRLFGLPVQMPSGWEVEQVEIEPASAGGVWRTRRDRGKVVVQIDFQTPLTSTSLPLAADIGIGPRPQVRIKIRARSTASGSVAGKSLPFPEVIVPGARFREGGLAIDVDDELLLGKPTTALPATLPEEEGPWGRQLPDLYYAYRTTPLTGQLAIATRPARFRSRIRSDVFLAASRASLRLELEAEAGITDSIDLLIPASVTPDWEWRVERGTNQIRRVERLPGPELFAVLASTELLASTPRLATWFVPAQARYRITLARPLRLRDTLVLVANVRLEVQDQRREVPLPVVPDAARLEGEVDLHATGTDPVRVETDGLRESTATPTRGRSAWRTYRYGNHPTRLLLSTNEPSAGRLSEVHARLTAWPCDDATLRVHYQFTLAARDQTSLPVRLPTGAEFLAARINGRTAYPGVRPETAGTVLDVPVPVRQGVAGWHRFEILYAIPSSPGWLWQTLDAPAPTLPTLEPLTLVRTWRLPPGLSPALAGMALRLPGPGDGLDPPARRVHPADLFRLIPWPRRWFDPADSAPEPVSTVMLANALKATRAGQEITLREMLEQVGLAATRERQDLVIDSGAWAEARLRLDGRIRLSPNPVEGEPAWEQAGLQIVPGSRGYLVTTRRQLESWSPGSRSIPEVVADAVEVALRDGHDRSGRFRTLSLWLPAQIREESQVEGRGGPDQLLPLDLELPGWSAWWPCAGVAEESLIVVRRETVSAAGVLLASLAGLGLFVLRSRARWRRRFWLIAWVAIAGLALFWLPTALQPLAWLPLVLGGLLVLLAYLKRLRKVTVGNPASLATATATAILLIVLPGYAAQIEESQPPARVDVWIVGKPDDAPEKQSVWLPPTLLEQLQRLGEAPSGRPREGAVLTAAECRGRVVEGAAEFELLFQIHSFAEEALLTVPLEGVHLLANSVWLDDARAHPTALPAPREGYRLPVRGVGKHKVELRFRVPIQTPGAGEHLVQFTLPRLPVSRLEFAVGGNELPRVATRLGAQESRTEGATTTVRADLGRLAGPVQIRWSGGVRPGAARVQFQEAYLWDLGADKSTLTAMLHYSIARGNVRELVLDLPDELLVRQITAQRPGGGEVRLQGFRNREGKPSAELAIRFPTPLTGELLVKIDLVPRGPLPSNVELALPVPRGEPTAGYLAYRVDGLDVRPSGNVRGVTGIQPETFAPFWPASSRPIPAGLVFAGSISRQGGTAPQLRLQLGPRSIPVQIEQELSLRIGATQVDLAAKIEVTSPAGEPQLIEWELVAAQPITLSAVRGAGLRRWSQQGNRLLVWLDRTSATRLDLQGWLAVGGDPKKPALALPQIRLVSVGKQNVVVRLFAQPGLSLEPQQLTGLRTIGDAAAFEPVYQSTGTSYGGTVRITAGGPQVTARLLTFVEVIDRRLHFQTLIACSIPQGELRTLAVTLHGWDGSADLSAERVQQRRERGRPGSVRTWSLDLQPGTTREYSLIVSGSIALGEMIGPTAIPEVTATGVRIAQSFVVVSGRDLTAEASTGLRAVQGLPADGPASWAKKLERARKTNAAIWQVVTAPWQLRVTAGEMDNDPTQPLQLLLEERYLRRSIGSRWLHESLCWLRVDQQTEVTIQFPKPARVVGVALGGVELPPLQPVNDRLWVPMLGQPGAAFLRIRWEYDPGTETLAHPEIAALKVENTTREGPTLWTVHLPEGWESGPQPALRDGPGPRAVQQLFRAEAASTLARELGELAKEQGVPTGLEPATLRRFYLQLRQAESLLERFPEAAREVGPDGIAVSEWASRLAEQTIEQARRLGYEDARAEAEKLARNGMLVVPSVASTMLPLIEERLAGSGGTRLSSEAPSPILRGRPEAGWTAVGSEASSGMFRPAQEGTLSRATMASLFWMGLVVLVVILSRIEFLVQRLRRLIPEQLLLVGGLGYAVAGWTPLTIGLLALGMTGRIVVLVRTLWPVSDRRPVSGGA